MTSALRRFGVSFILLSFFYFLLVVTPDSVIASDIRNGKVIGDKDVSIADTQSNSTTEVKNESISINGNTIIVDGDVQYNGKKIPLILEGNLLPIEKTSDHVLFGDLKNKGNEELKFMQFMVDLDNNNEPLVKMLLEHNKTKELLVFQFNIDDNLFRNLKEISKDNSQNLSEEALIEKTNELNRAPRNHRSHLLSLDEGISETEESSNLSQESNSLNKNTEVFADDLKDSVDRDEYIRLIKDLKNAGHNKWIDYSSYSLPKSLVTTEGFFRDVKYSNDNLKQGNFVYGYSFEDAYGAYLVGTSNMESFITKHDVKDELIMQLTMTNAITFKYDPETNQVKLHLKDRGLKQKDMKLAFRGLDGVNKFISDTTNGVLQNPSDVNTQQLFSRLVSIVPKGEKVSGVWDFLKVLDDDGEPTSKLGQTYYYKNKHENISSESGDLYLNKPGDYFNLVIEVDGSDGFGWGWGWKLVNFPNF